MLKIVKTLMVTATASLLFTGAAQADINTALQNICTIVKADDKSQLRKKMKKVRSDYRMKLKDYYAGVSCNGNSLIRTAMLNDALETGELLVKKMPKSSLTSREDDGKTLLTWISDNGLESSPITTVINDRF